MTIIFDVRPLMGGKLSGVEIYIRHLLKHLIRLDRNITWILFANASSDQSQHLPHFEETNVITIQTRIPNKLLNIGLSFFGRPRLDRLIKKRLPEKIKPDIFFLPDLRPVSVSRGVKTIAAVHDLSFHHFPKFFSAKTRLWHRLINPKKLLRRCDRIIAVSDFTKNDLVQTYGLPEKKIQVIHEGIEPDFCSGKDPEQMARIRAKYWLPHEYFLFLSTLEPRKNLQRLIEAFRLYKETHQDDVKLVLTGTRNGKIFSRLHLQNNPDLVFTGFVPEDDKPHLFAMAKAFLYPSLFEGFGLPLLEAMKCGTPIITSNTSSMPEVCGKAALFVNPESIEEMAETMEIVQRPGKVEELKQAMEKQITHFSWERCARETLRLLKTI